MTGYPTFFFIDGNGKVIHKIVGARNADGFISEANMISMYARHGGIDNMMAAIKNGTASKELLYDYYTSANEKNKPVALNLYLKSLPTKELIDVDNKLIDEISLYDKELMTRLVEEIVKFSHGEKFNDKEFVGRYSFNIVFPVQYDITTFLEKSITEGNLEWFNELLELKEKFNHYTGRLLDGDLNIQRGRGIFFATPEYIKLCYWTKNRTNEEGFRDALTTYMDKLIRENHVDSLIKEDQNGTLKIIKEAGNLKGQMKFSPSDKKTKELCTQWINYAFNINRFNDRVAVPAADVLARIGNFKEAKLILEKAIASQKELGNDNPQVYKKLELKLRDIHNHKR